MDKYEYSDKRICKHNIQRETCRECLFEVLCHLEEGGKNTYGQKKTSEKK